MASLIIEAFMKQFNQLLFHISCRGFYGPALVDWSIGARWGKICNKMKNLKFQPHICLGH